MQMLNYTKINCIVNLLDLKYYIKNEKLAY